MCSTDYQGQKDLIINAANAMPDDTFNYKSTPAQRDFAAQVMHIVIVNQNMLGTLGAKTPKPAINDKGHLEGRRHDGPQAGL
jgi:hypothetical protein